MAIFLTFLLGTPVLIALLYWLVYLGAKSHYRANPK